MSGVQRKGERELDKKVTAGVADLTKKRNDECIPIAKYLFKEFAARIATLPMGTVTESEADLYYKQMFTEAMSQMLVDRNVKVTELDYIFQIMLQAVEFLHAEATRSVGRAVDNANAKRWGLEDVDDLRIRHVTFTLAGEELPEGVDNYFPFPEK